MRKHNGMRPQDVLVLLKMVSLGETPWRYSDMAKALHISQSEVAEALHRSMQARLVDPSKRKVFRSSLLEFLTYGLKYVFPAQPGAIMRGMPTAHAAPPLDEQIVAGGDAYVWPHESGSARGQAIMPLYPSVIKAAQEDQGLYELLALVDAIRVGRAREHRIAVAELEKRIKADVYAGKDFTHAANRGLGLR